MSLSVSARTALALVAAIALAGCAENRYCAKPQAYESAPSIPPIQSAGSMKIEPSPDAYLIPSPAAHPVPFGQKVENSGKTQWSCLDQPPALPASGPSTSANSTQKP